MFLCLSTSVKIISVIIELAINSRHYLPGINLRQPIQFFSFVPTVALIDITSLIDIFMDTHFEAWKTLLFPFLSSFKGHMIIHLLFDLERSQMEAQRGISETTTLICTFTWQSIIRKELKMPWSAWKLGKLLLRVLKNTIHFAETEKNWSVLTVILTEQWSQAWRVVHGALFCFVF